ncbi:MAG: hypothetical protein GEV11_24250 [Streptosporangiales bacterium]|nr:hypothetical protein [Streptosporangiales bacterium]
MTQGDYGDWLRGRDDDELAALFRARPDLITPVPADVAALAARASSTPAVTRVVDRLDRFALHVLEALLVLHEPATYDELHVAVLGGDEENVPKLHATFDRLRALTLIWGEDSALRSVAALREILTTPAGLGPSARALFAGRPPERLAYLLDDLGVESTGNAPEALAATLADPDRLAALLTDAGPEAEEALRRLAWGPPVGKVEDAQRPVRTESARSPIERLLARGLLVATDDNTVTLPREVALYLRAGRLFASAEADPPTLTGRERDPSIVDRAAGGQAFTMIRAVEDLLEAWSVEPPPVLRAGGLGVRELRRAAQILDTDDATAALYVEMVAAAGLIAESDEGEPEWLPTKAYDLWRVTIPERRWSALTTAWLAGTRVPALTGGKDDRGRMLNALGEGLDRGNAPELRRQVLETLAEAAPGTALDIDAVRDYLGWLRPRRQGQLREMLLESTLREAAVLGVTGLSAMSGPGRSMLTDGRPPAEEALRPLLPDPVDHVLIQGDMTAVAPGPLVPELARELALAADVESTGGATVYRFSESSVRRALDAGRGGSDVLELLERASRTPVPQALRYLIDDTARRHGRVRVGTASAYLRSDDPAMLSELLADRRASELGLFRLAPTVLASRTPRGGLLETLRTLGYAPVAESPEGAMVLTRPDARRSVERAPRGLTEPPAPDDTVLVAAVRAVRAGDAAATAVRKPITAPEDEPPRSPVAATMAALNAAVGSGSRVWIGYLDAQGQASSRIVEPARVEGGYLTAYDATRAAVHRFALHRITGVAEISETEPAPS